jgi:hypothetical protein
VKNDGQRGRAYHGVALSAACDADTALGCGELDHRYAPRAQGSGCRSRTIERGGDVGIKVVLLHDVLYSLCQW